jgi:hypothetical protein
MGRSITRLIVCAEETSKSQSKPYEKKTAKTQNQKSHPTPELDCEPKKTPNPRNQSFVKQTPTKDQDPSPTATTSLMEKKSPPRKQTNKQTDTPKINGVARQK